MLSEINGKDQRRGRSGSDRPQAGQIRATGIPKTLLEKHLNDSFLPGGELGNFMSRNARFFEKLKVVTQVNEIVEAFRAAIQEKLNELPEGEMQTLEQMDAVCTLIGKEKTKAANAIHESSTGLSPIASSFRMTVEKTRQALRSQLLQSYPLPQNADEALLMKVPMLKAALEFWNKKMNKLAEVMVGRVDDAMPDMETLEMVATYDQTMKILADMFSNKSLVENFLMYSQIGPVDVEKAKEVLWQEVEGLQQKITKEAAPTIIAARRESPAAPTLAETNRDLDQLLGEILAMEEADFNNATEGNGNKSGQSLSAQADQEEHEVTLKMAYCKELKDRYEEEALEFELLCRDFESVDDKSDLSKEDEAELAEMEMIGVSLANEVNMIEEQLERIERPVVIIFE